MAPGENEFDTPGVSDWPNLIQGAKPRLTTYQENVLHFSAWTYWNPPLGMEVRGDRRKGRLWGERGKGKGLGDVPNMKHWLVWVRIGVSLSLKLGAGYD